MPAILKALREQDFGKEILHEALLFCGDEQKELFELAREERKRCFPSGQIETRSVIELSNICAQACNFCSIASKPKEQQYIIDYDRFLQMAEYIYTKGRRVLLVQSGENRSQSFVDHVCRCIQGLKDKYSDVLIILCSGNLKFEQYKQLRQAGAERYILKFETSNPRLYKNLKPRDSLERRLECLENLLSLDFKVGSGNMIGFPGQTIDDIINDLLLLGRYNLNMSSCSVFIAGEDSNYRGKPMGDIGTALNMMALMRIMYPERLIPSTSSLEKARRGGQLMGLMAGANVLTIHDGTPEDLKDMFPIYSSKRFTPDQEHILGVARKANLTISPGELS